MYLYIHICTDILYIQKCTNNNVYNKAEHLFAYLGATARRHFANELYRKSGKLHKKSHVSESLFNKAASCKSATFSKKESNIGVPLQILNTSGRLFLHISTLIFIVFVIENIKFNKNSENNKA